MHVLSINVGYPELLKSGKSSQPTGIIKRPVRGEMSVTKDGLPGDAICNQKYHGGPDQAVYVYGQPDYDWWEASLGRKLEPGIFGENLTITDLESASLHLGDRFMIGDAVLEVTSPRVPCATLAGRMEDSGFVKKFRAAERPGVYCRVITKGVIRTGDQVDYQPFAGDRVSIIEVYRDAFRPRTDTQRIRRQLAAPIAIRMRVAMEAQLAKKKSEAQ
ncbi:MAG: MOSC domain-containing protein [Chthoniobacterales bacterium]